MTPPERNQLWLDPIQVELDSFRWTLRNGQSVVRVPAVACTLFGKPDELDELEVARQAKIALTRAAENLDLVELRGRFGNREYAFRSLQIQVPMRVQPENQPAHKNQRRKTSTLRAVASDLGAAQLPSVYGMDEKAAELAEHFSGERSRSGAATDARSWLHMGMVGR